MLYIYVKHYLNDKGIKYFEDQWFPQVYSIISQQKGFVEISFHYSQYERDCVNIFLVFTDQETLDKWVAHPFHDKLIEGLDIYRSRDYWEATCTEEKSIDPSSLKWDVIKPKSI
jgi:hypothetical protein